MGKVFVAGSINMDIVVTAVHQPAPGETLTGSRLNFFPGGKGANQAVAAAKLGAETVLIARIGADNFGADVLNFLKSQGLPARYIHKTTGASTGAAAIIVADNGENSIVAVPGANLRLSAKDINKLPNFKKADVLVSQLETPPKTIERFFRKGRRAGATVILNPAPAKGSTKHLLDLADVIVVNETELAFYGGRKKVSKSGLPAAAKKLQSHARQVIIVTLGASGCFVLDGDKKFRVPGRKVKTVDTTGAGDCFVGALAAELAQGKTLKQAAAYANIAASIAVQRPGAGPSMPTAPEVAKQLK